MGFLSILKMKCPRCRVGNMFKNSNAYNFRDVNKMHDACPACQQDFVIEPGFYFGSAYVSYALNCAWIVPLFLISFFVLDLSYEITVITMLAMLPILMPWIYRISRTAFLAIYVRFDPKISAQAQKSISS